MSRPQRDDLELVVLAVLADSAQYGYAITKAVDARSDGRIRVGPSVLYPLLARLEKSGYVTARWDEVSSDRTEGPGRRRKWYALSSKGERRLAQHIEAHRARVSMLETFIAPHADAEPTP